MKRLSDICFFLAPCIVILAIVFAIMNRGAICYIFCALSILSSSAGFILAEKARKRK